MYTYKHVCVSFCWGFRFISAIVGTNEHKRLYVDDVVGVLLSAKKNIKHIYIFIYFSLLANFFSFCCFCFLLYSLLFFIVVVNILIPFDIILCLCICA